MSSRHWLVIALGCTLFVAAVTGARAVTQSVTANIRFDTPLTLTKISDINFGAVPAGNASTYRISTDGTVSTVTGTGSPLFGPTAAGNITVAGSKTQLVNISVGGYTTSNGVTLSNARCVYHSGAEGSCTMSGVAAPNNGRTLLVGVDATADGTQAAGTSATPTLAVTVVYQ
jgi:hypothetical protein